MVDIWNPVSWSRGTPTAPDYICSEANMGGVRIAVQRKPIGGVIHPRGHYYCWIMVLPDGPLRGTHRYENRARCENAVEASLKLIAAARVHA